ncbi:MAG: hypothetical protein SXU28_03935 [Pseudomonadota bacterium]|nr:hypothetical protein [Pseudomonadota bacterium]
MKTNIIPSRSLATLLLVGASSIALVPSVQANEILYTSQEDRVRTGDRVSQTSGVTQISLTGGGTASFVDAAEYRINEDGSIDLYSGSVTIAGTGESPVIVRMPEGLEAQVSGEGSAANFNVQGLGQSSGHVLSGDVRIGRGRRMSRFDEGSMWSAPRGGRPRRVIANAAQATPDGTGNEPQVASLGGDAGPVAAAQNGIPVVLGDALAAAGASSDILGAARRVELAVGNPSLETFPSGDLALLIARAAQIESSFGGSPFPQAQADIIRTYLRFLAGGGSGAEFLTTFSAFSIDYLDLIRAGGVPSTFTSASGNAGLADINAYLAFINRTGALASLSASDRVLADAYLAFLRDGGNPDLFAGSFTDLTSAYFAFVRAGNAPADFGGASAAVIEQTIAFLSQSGLIQQLNAADRALVLAFLDNGGLAFAGQFQTALDDYFAFLASGRLPSEYEPINQATLRAYLETLSDTGLLESVLGDQAGFYASYLAFLRAGGNVDAFAGLPANVFAGYAVELQAYFAFLEAGGIPSTYEPLSQDVIAQYLAALEGAGATGLFLPELGEFYTAYFAFLSDGGNPDNFAGLPVPPDFPAFAAALNAYADFLANGGFPTDFTDQDLSALADFIEALRGAGELQARLGANADFLTAYFAFIEAGGAPDAFAGLPVYADYVTALNAYFAFLSAGGLPAEYTVLDQATINAYLAALANAQGGLAGFGDLEGFFAGYASFVLAGGDPATFAGLPVFAEYIAALNAYFEFLANGGVPSEYTVLSQEILNAYLAALANAQGGLVGFAQLDAFFIDFFAFISGGGNADAFDGLPVNSGGGGTGGGSVDPLPQLAGLNSVILVPGLGILQDAGSEADISEDGRITALTITENRSTPITYDFASRDDDVREIGRIGNDVAWTRYFNGSARQNDLLLVGNPATNLPVSGTVNYRLVGGTAPINVGVGRDEEAYFTGNLALAFGQSSARLGFDFDLLYGTEGYRVGTNGGAAGAANSNVVIGNTGNPEFTLLNLSPTALTGTSCNGFCDAQVYGSLFGEGAGSAGFTYTVFDRGAGNNIQGIAIFATEGEELAGLGTAPDNSIGGGVPVVGGVDQFDTSGLVTASISYGNEGFTRTSRTNQTDVSDTGVLNSIATRSRGTARGDQIIGDQYAIIGRWVDGDVTFPTGARSYTTTENDAAHWAIVSVGERDFNLRGSIEYDLLGATTPTYSDGRTTPGTFDGSLSINWLSSTLMGIDFAAQVTMPDATYDWTFSSGNFLPRLQGVFESNATVDGVPCANNGCQAAVSYQFGGANMGERFAINYNISIFAEDLDIGGSALFGAPGTFDPQDYPNTATSAATSGKRVIAGIDMSRWGGVDASKQGTFEAPVAALLPEGAARPANSRQPTEARSRAAAIRRAEALMGGAITFAQPAGGTSVSPR